MTSQPLALLIEDDPDLITIFSMALEDAGFLIESISEGDAALARLGDVIPSVVVLDLHLPNVSGTFILDSIRADERLSATRVIIVSADPQLAESVSGEADLVLVKPISFNQLRDLAHRLIR